MKAMLLLAALAAQADEAGPDWPDLGWLSGYWLSCANGREVSETWSDRRGDLMLGTSMTFSPSGATGWEQMRIAPSTMGGFDSLSFYAQPGGQSAAEFPMARAGSNEIVFEDPSHDFPQRVIYRRDGAQLVGRIEGTVEGREQSAEWRFDPAPLNARCPATEGERG